MPATTCAVEGIAGKEGLWLKATGQNDAHGKHAEQPATTVST
jgi:hypothetical protein